MFRGEVFIVLIVTERVYSLAMIDFSVDLVYLDRFFIGSDRIDLSAWIFIGSDTIYDRVDVYSRVDVHRVDVYRVSLLEWMFIADSTVVIDDGSFNHSRG